MNSLDLFSIRSLMQAVTQIHSTRDILALPESFFSAVRGLVPGAVFTIDELDLTTGVVSELTSVERLLPEDIKKRTMELMPTHPAMPAYKAGRRGAIRVTDCISQRQFRQTPHYLETLQPIDIHYQMVVTLDIPGKIAGMTVNRDKNFTDKETTLLHLIAPQIALAHRNVQVFTGLKQAAAKMIPTPEEIQRLGFTPRESEVLHWVIQGKRDTEIGKILSASPRTVHNHVRSILRKLKTETRTAAALEVLEGVQRLNNSATLRCQ
jgi:DNA-binding CsgD family transcriptional regulator